MIWIFCFKLQSSKWFFQMFWIYIAVLGNFILNWKSWYFYQFLIFLSLIFTFYMTSQQSLCSSQRLKTVVAGLHNRVDVATNGYLFVCMRIYPNELVSMCFDIWCKFENISEKRRNKVKNFILRLKMTLIVLHLIIE